MLLKQLINDTSAGSLPEMEIHSPGGREGAGGRKWRGGGGVILFGSGAVHLLDARLRRLLHLAVGLPRFMNYELLMIPAMIPPISFSHVSHHTWLPVCLVMSSSLQLHSRLLKYLMPIHSPSYDIEP